MPWPKLRLQKPRPGALALVPLPAATSVAIHCAPEPRERREKGKKGEESAKAAVEEEVVGAKDDTGVSSPTRFGTALHGYRSYMASNQHGTTIHSSMPPTVSPPSGLSLPPNLTVGHGALYHGRVGQCLVSGH